VSRKIAVMGGSCSGKTTLAGLAAERLGVPHVELDALHHGPNWHEATAEELQARVAAALDGLDGWVVDGNYLTKLGTTIVDQADTIIWLDVPRRVWLPRMWRRTTRRIRDGTELWATGNRETWPNFLFKWNGLLLYELRRHNRRRREMAALYPRNVVRLRTPDEAERWLSSLREAEERAAHPVR
jgi:adenylate kinase family enzyme